MLPPIQYVKTRDGSSIAFIELGKGSPVVFASNIFGDLQSYRGGIPHVRLVSDRLADSGYHVVRYDVRGMGASDREVADIGLAARVSDIEAIVTRLGFDRFTLCGADLGTATAVAFAAAHPEMVSRLILLCPWASGKAMFALPDFKVVRGMSPAAQREWEVFTNSLADVVTGFNDPALRKATAEVMRAGATAEGLYAYYAASERINVTPLLGTVRAPTLVIHDTAFPFGSFDLCRDVAAGIDQAELITLDGCFIAGNDQAKYLDAIGQFLSRDGGAKPSARLPGQAPISLTPREIAVLRLIAGGYTNQEIADELEISERTVARHITNLYIKIDVSSKAGATAYALMHGLV